MIKQHCTFFPNTDIIKDYYEYLDDILVYMEETNEEQSYIFGIDFDLEEYHYGFLKGQKNRIFKGRNIFTDGPVYAPYISVQTNPVVINADFAPRHAISSRYQLATINHHYYRELQND